MTAVVAFLVDLFARPFRDFVIGLEIQLAVRRSPATLARILAGALASWWVYVPVHELMHVLGCEVSGGSVNELQVSPLYGGALLAKWFVFVVPGGDYAGRLSGFDTGGSDLVYLATDAMPYLLTIFVGVPLLRWSGGRRRPVLFGAAIPLAFAPVYSIPGDYYEMGSILVTRAMRGFVGDLSLLRSDDVIRLITDLAARPAELHLHSGQEVAAAAVVIATSLAVGTMLAFLTYRAGGWLVSRR
jgi:hypothetical protein